MKKIGRNDPCPCGSGKKYKKCCIKSETFEFSDGPTIMEERGTPNMATDFLNSFKATVGDQVFENEDELNAKLESFRIASNETAQMDFLGLSPSDIHSMRGCRLDDMPEFVELQFPLDEPEYLKTPISIIAISIMLCIGTEGRAKATGKGNLPLSIVKEINDSIGDIFLKPRVNPRSEEDLQELCIIRNLMEFSGFIELKDRFFQLTDLGDETLSMVRENQSASRLFRRLFLAYTDEFNWLFGTDMADEFGGIQDTSAFCLYLLRKKAKDYISEDTLAKLYARAFPITGKLYLYANPRLGGNLDPKILVADVFTDIYLYRYCWMFGLLEQNSLKEPDPFPEFRTTALFRKAFKWNV